MNVQVRTTGIDLVETVHRHLERRVRQALRWWSGSEVLSVSLRLSDVNGPRGGTDLHCAVSVALPSRATVHAEATDSDAFAAVSKALERARRSLDRGSRRERRGPMRDPLVGVRFASGTAGATDLHADADEVSDDLSGQ
jgi:ribosomal subunit interface protein